MLVLDLALLEREGAVQIDADIPPDAPLWEESGLTFDQPLEARLRAHEAGSGEIVVTGRLKGHRSEPCRLCLDPVGLELELEIVMVFGDAAESGGEIRPLDPAVVKLELDEAVREEILLNVDRFVDCGPDCKGLCPDCGVNLNDETCDCTLDEPDPRWDALRSLKIE